MKTGLERLTAENFARVRGKRVALLANAASVDAHLRHLVDLAAAAGIRVERIFAPEHGLTSAPQDMVAVDGGRHPGTGIPVVSLYGKGVESLAPRDGDLSGIDLLIADLPDVGSRYYTYAQTLAHAMATCGRTGTNVLVLDRPNPINGVEVEGGPLKKACRSFCGLAPVAQRHGLTLGELALVYRHGFGEGEDALPPIPCDLEILRLEGWEREQCFDATGLPWVLPSPNLPTLDTALVYPGGCLFEATKVSEGRGTTRPFELLGAPFIDGEAWAEAALQEKVALDGAILRPVNFQPMFHKHGGRPCGGVQIHVTDRRRFRPFRLGLALIASLRKLCGAAFEWRTEPYEFIADVPAIDLLYGSANFRKAVDGDGNLAPVEQELAEFEDSYRRRRTEFLLY